MRWTCSRVLSGIPNCKTAWLSELNQAVQLGVAKAKTRNLVNISPPQATPLARQSTTSIRLVLNGHLAGIACRTDGPAIRSPFM